MSNPEEHTYNADISQLMNLIINSFYSKKEIFLRELLSNASDALEKSRYLSLTNQNSLSNNNSLKIKLKVNKDENFISIQDNGVGMTKEDIINCLGTIAKSGTKSFFENIEKLKGTEHIGQFGVGFYSAFLVADKVKVVTKNDNDKEYIWESNSKEKFTISENTDSNLERGTEIILFLKESESEYLDTERLKAIVKNIQNLLIILLKF